MTTITGYTAVRMKEIEDSAVIDGQVVGDNLKLVRFDGGEINAGNVRGPQGPPGPTDAGETILEGSGIDLTGVTDSSVAVQALVSAATGPVLGVPGATYKFGNINLKNDSDVRGNGASLISTAAAGGGAFVSTGRTNVSVSGWKALGVSKSSLLKMVGGSIVDCLNNDVLTMQIFQSNSANGNLYTGSSATENVDIHIQGNRASGPIDLTGSAGIFLLYCSDVVVNDNDITGYTSGIQYWGGDANGNGAAANDRKCKRIWIFQNKIRDCGGGGAWGSMGEYIRIWSNYVYNVGDIGIDFEGSFDCRAFFNTVIDSFVANFATFFICREIDFHKNTSIATTPGDCAFLFLIKNVSGDTAKATGNGKISFTENNAYVMTGIGSPPSFEACHHLIFTGNKLRNTKIIHNINNTHNVTISRNTFVWDSVASTAFNAIDVGQNHQSGDGFPPLILINENILNSENIQPAGSRGIYSIQDDINSSPVLEITRNYVYGFPSDIVSAWIGINAATFLLARIWDNVVFNGITSTNTGAAIPQDIRTWLNRRAYTGGVVTGGATLSVTGSRGANAALASLLTQLATLGLIVDNSVV